MPCPMLASIRSVTRRSARRHSAPRLCGSTTGRPHSCSKWSAIKSDTESAYKDPCWHGWRSSNCSACIAEINNGSCTPQRNWSLGRGTSRSAAAKNRDPRWAERECTSPRISQSIRVAGGMIVSNPRRVPHSHLRPIRTGTLCAPPMWYTITGSSKGSNAASRQCPRQPQSEPTGEKPRAQRSPKVVGKPKPVLVPVILSVHFSSGRNRARRFRQAVDKFEIHFALRRFQLSSPTPAGEPP